MIRFYLPLIILLFIAKISYGQINLIPNGDFEQYTICPPGTCDLQYCTGWTTPSTTVSSEYFNSCNNHYVGIPENFVGFQYAHSGNGYTGIGTLYAPGSGDNPIEYMECNMKGYLQQNICYHVSFFISLAESSMYTSPNVGIYFSNTIISDFSYYPIILPFNPQVSNTTIWPDTTNWTLIEGDFIAGGGEKYAIIGNFNGDSLTLYNQVNDGIYAMPATYIYIDDVSLIKTDLSNLIPHDTTISLGDSIYIGGPTGIGLDDDCIWYADGIAIDTIAGMWIKPDKTTTYVLQQDICGNVKYDTVTVTVSGVGIGEYGWGGKIMVYPNPAKDILNIEGLPDNAIAEIYSINGKLLLNEVITIQQINIRGLHDGMYFIKLSTKEGSLVRKFVKE
jgi:hypothetical protein